jgi:hypothetical protein
MSDNWDFYACRVDDEPASIFLDLDLAKVAPLKERPFMAYVRVYMRQPRPDGLSSREEFEDLTRLEDHLSGALIAAARATYVGRNTSGGCRDFYFYTAEADGWSQQVAGAMAGFADYQYEAGSRLDREWKTYFEFLYPSEQDRQRIRNRRVCESLEKNGDALVEPRPIDHWAYFPDERSRAKFVEHIDSLGFTVRGLSESERSETPFGVQFFRVDLPSFESIDAVTLPLHKAAAEAGGDYDGWETQVIS